MHNSMHEIDTSSPSIPPSQNTGGERTLSAAPHPLPLFPLSPLYSPLSFTSSSSPPHDFLLHAEVVEPLPLPGGGFVLARRQHLLLLLQREPWRLEPLLRLVLDDVDQTPEIPGGEEGAELPGGERGRGEGRRSRHSGPVAQPLRERYHDRLGHGSRLSLSNLSQLEAVVLVRFQDDDGRDRGLGVSGVGSRELLTSYVFLRPCLVRD